MAHTRTLIYGSYPPPRDNYLKLLFALHYLQHYLKQFLKWLSIRNPLILVKTLVYVGAEKTPQHTIKSIIYPHQLHTHGNKIHFCDLQRLAHPWHTFLGHER